MIHEVHVECEIPKSFEVDQVRGMFDLKAEKVAGETFNVELPELDEDWQIGVIVGPSGSGKTSVARHAYGRDFVESVKWDKRKAVVDQFGRLSIKDITQTLSSVGFSSPPSWIKPHHVLSGGERFRCDLARALLRPGPLVAFDEFTSVVDRTVAKIGSAAVAKSIRKGHIKKRFVAVTCHYDVIEWLQPDWVLDMASRQLARGCLYQRPAIELKITPVHHSAWDLFRRHHYLSHYHKCGAKCFLATWDGEPVAFSSWATLITGAKESWKVMREHRTVVLPDFQGVGIGNRLSELVAAYWLAVGKKAVSTTSHPSMIHYRHNSAKWTTRRFGFCAPPGKRGFRSGVAADRVTGSFEFIGEPMDAETAARLSEGLSGITIETADAHRILNVIQPPHARSLRSIAAQTGLAIDHVHGLIEKLIDTRQIDVIKYSPARRSFVAASAETSSRVAAETPRRKK